MKQVIQGVNKKIVLVEDVDSFNIYAFKSNSGEVYKAHRVQGGLYAFVDMATSQCYANDVHSSLQKLIEYTLATGYEVFEFDNFKEFVEWLNDEV